MPHRIEEGLVKIAQGLQDEQRWKKDPRLFPENVAQHTLKLLVIVQLVKMMVRKYDSEIEFDGEILSDLATIHDFGEAADDFGDIQEPYKTEEDERLEKVKFQEMVVFLPIDFQGKLLSLYDIQKGSSIESRLFRASELFVRLYYCLREIDAGNVLFYKPLWTEYKKIQPFLEEFKGLKIMFEPIQEFLADLH
ncbi:MAG: YfbR-like 5'-deoxynucleotidase [Patescibacteria group bacterium]|jgi:5'-deoxynucleotidase YfbR-like HD superfamily hydrolase